MTRQNLTDYIKESANREFLAEHKVKKYRIFNTVELIINDPLPQGFDLEGVLKKVQTRIPEHFVSQIDMIIIGDIPMLRKKGADAYYAEGIIYLMNNPSNVDDMYEDIAHEIAHSLETELSEQIYGDGQIEYEFVSKRKMLYHLLSQHGYQRPQMDFINADYDESFDNFLYKEVGYDTIRNIAPNLFLSPYAATSVREYFANGFEAMYVGEEKDYIKRVSPKLYDKLEQLYYMGRFDAETEMAYNMEQEKGWSNKHGY